MQGNEVITHEVGTFKPVDRKETTKTLNGTVWNVPARRVVGLRPPKFEAELAPEVILCRDNQRSADSGIAQNTYRVDNASLAFSGPQFGTVNISTQYSNLDLTGEEFITFEMRLYRTNVTFSDGTRITREDYGDAHELYLPNYRVPHTSVDEDDFNAFHITFELEYSELEEDWGRPRDAPPRGPGIPAVRGGFIHILSSCVNRPGSDLDDE